MLEKQQINKFIVDELGKIEDVLKPIYIKRLSFLETIGSTFASKVVDFLYRHYGKSFTILNKHKIKYIDITFLFDDIEENVKNRIISNRQRKRETSSSYSNTDLDIIDSNKIEILYDKYLLNYSNNDSKLKKTDKIRILSQSQKNDKAKFRKIIFYLLDLSIVIQSINSFYGKKLHIYPVPLFLISNGLNLKSISSFLEKLYCNYRFFSDRENFETLLSFWQSGESLYQISTIKGIALTPKDISIIDALMLNSGIELNDLSRIDFFIHDIVKKHFFGAKSNGSTKISLNHFIHYILEGIIDASRDKYKNYSMDEVNALKTSIKDAIHELCVVKDNKLVLIENLNRKYVAPKKFVDSELDIIDLIENSSKEFKHIQSIKKEDIRGVLLKQSLSFDSATINNLQKILSNGTSILCGSAGTGKTSYVLMLINILNNFYEYGVYIDRFPVMNLEELLEITNSQINYCNSYKTEYNKELLDYKHLQDTFESLEKITSDNIKEILKISTQFKDVESPTKKSQKILHKTLLSSFNMIMRCIKLGEQTIADLSNLDIEIVDICDINNLSKNTTDEGVSNTSFIQPLNQASSISLLKRFIIDKYKFFKDNKEIKFIKNIEEFFQKNPFSLTFQELELANKKLLEFFITDYCLHLIVKFLEKTISILNSKKICPVIITSFTGKAISNVENRINSHFKSQTGIGNTIHKLLYGNYVTQHNIMLPFVNLDVLIRSNRSGFIKIKAGSIECFIGISPYFTKEYISFLIRSKSSFSSFIQNPGVKEPFYIYDNYQHLRKIHNNSLIIIDECTMVDIELFQSFLQLTTRDSKQNNCFLLIGDNKQLPSIKPGHFFSDLIASSCFNKYIVKLEQNLRSADKLNKIINSIFISNTEEIVEINKAIEKVETPIKILTENIEEDFSLNNALEEISKDNIKKYAQYDWQIITPYNTIKYNFSAVSINAQIQNQIYKVEYRSIIPLFSSILSPINKIRSSIQNFEKEIIKLQNKVTKNSEEKQKKNLSEEKNKIMSIELKAKIILFKINNCCKSLENYFYYYSSDFALKLNELIKSVLNPQVEVKKDTDNISALVTIRKNTIDKLELLEKKLEQFQHLEESIEMRPENLFQNKEKINEDKDLIKKFFPSLIKFYIDLFNRGGTYQYLSSSSSQVYSQLKKLNAEDFTSSTYSINYLLDKKIESNSSNYLNSPTTFKNFFVGDKVIYVKNNYELMIFNGFIGSIKAIFFLNNYTKCSSTFLQRHRELFVVEFNNKEYIFTSQEIVLNVKLAYAITVHKVQGSEYKNVVFILPDHRSSSFITSNLVYTAFTRAISKLYLISTSTNIINFCKRLREVKRSTIIPVIIKSK